MAVNTAATIGRMRYAPAISNSLSRLIKDGEKAKALAIKLESELVDEKPDTEEGGESSEVEMKDVQDGLEGKVGAGFLKEVGSKIVQEILDKVLGEEGLSGDEDLSEEQKVKKVSCRNFVFPRSIQLTSRRNSYLIIGSHTSVQVSQHVITA